MVISISQVNILILYINYIFGKRGKSHLFSSLLFFPPPPPLVYSFWLISPLHPLISLFLVGFPSSSSTSLSSWLDSLLHPHLLSLLSWVSFFILDLFIFLVEFPSPSSTSLSLLLNEFPSPSATSLSSWLSSRLEGEGIEIF